MSNRGKGNSLWTEAVGKVFCWKWDSTSHPSRELGNVCRHFCLTQWLTFSVFVMSREGTGMLKIWHAGMNCPTPNAKSTIETLGHWVSLNSRYWVGGISLLKRGQKISMVVDCANRAWFRIQVEDPFCLQESCKTLDKPGVNFGCVVRLRWVFPHFPSPFLGEDGTIKWALNWEATAGIAGITINLTALNKEYLIIQGNQNLFVFCSFNLMF